MKKYKGSKAVDLIMSTEMDLDRIERKISMIKPGTTVRLCCMDDRMAKMWITQGSIMLLNKYGIDYQVQVKKE